VAIGELITVTMTLSNGGQSAAYAVSPTALNVVAGSSGSVVLVSPSSVTGVVLASGESYDFIWTYSATAGGIVSFEGQAKYIYGATTITVDVTGSNDVSIEFGQATGVVNEMYLTANSFNPDMGQSVGIIFSSAAAGNAKISVYNIAGQKVRAMSYPVVPGILYTQLAVWDGKADDGMFVTTGMYYIRLEVGSYSKALMIAVKK
jgi:hypothetical protein